MDKQNTKHKWMILSVCVNNIYQSQGSDREGDCDIKSKPFDKFITAYNNKYNGNASNYETNFKILPEKHHMKKQICMEDCFISVILSLLTDECFIVLQNDNCC
jgi:dGTPase